MRRCNESFEPFVNDSIELNMKSIKSKLIIIITALIIENGWSQRVAAEKLNVTQPRISNLMNGQVSKFAIDMLLEILCKLGFILDITFKPLDKESPIEFTVKKAML